MVIEVEDAPHTLIGLLWVREACGLRPTGDGAPPLLEATPDPLATAVDTSGWADAWPVVWSAAVAHAGQVRDPSLFEALRATANGSAERSELLARMIGPSARDRFGEAFDESWDRWSAKQSAAHRSERSHTLEEQPERRSLNALILAWERGLTKIVTIPVRGDHVQTIGPHALLTTDAVRASPIRYEEALARFGETSP